MKKKKKPIVSRKKNHDKGIELLWKQLRDMIVTCTNRTMQQQSSRIDHLVIDQQENNEWIDLFKKRIEVMDQTMGVFSRGNASVLDALSQCQAKNSEIHGELLDNDAKLGAKLYYVNRKVEWLMLPFYKRWFRSFDKMPVTRKDNENASKKL